MLKRTGDDISTHPVQPGNHPNRPPSPDPLWRRSSEATGSTSATELILSPRHVALSSVIPAKDTPSRANHIASGTSTSLTPSIVTGVRPQPICFRISGIPPHWSTNNLENALQLIDPELNFIDVELSELIPDCCDNTQIALLNFDYCTAYFRSFERNEERYRVIRESGRKVRLVIDKHFYDLTPLNCPTTPIIAESVLSP
jgi:hypothetical protein